MPDLDDKRDPILVKATRGDVNSYVSPYIPARILWPALGFPAVIDPKAASKSDNASTCISVLMVSSWPQITKKQAAYHLRFVPWDQRHTRYLPPGPGNGFTEDEIEVRQARTLPGNAKETSDEFAERFYFGADATGANGISAGLSKFVLQHYASKEWGSLKYIHEIRISRAGSSRLAAGQHNLFWINSDPKDTAGETSEELELLLARYALPSREALLKSLGEEPEYPHLLHPEFEQANFGSFTSLDYLILEYQYDYDLLHPPYNERLPKAFDPQKRTEVLHPLFVQAAVDQLKIGHVTDLHYSVRADIYEENLITSPGSKQTGVVFEGQTTVSSVSYSNWNQNATRQYEHAKKTCDVLLLTGDLIDFGRGPFPIVSAADEGQDWIYQTDRNWFLFYYALAAGTSYSKPAYTILGNHDWRLNPYPPFAPGAPEPESIFNPDENRYSDKQLEYILQCAHGPGYDKAFSYSYQADGALALLGEAPGVSIRSLYRLWRNTKTLNIKHFPSETSIDSVAWYLLLINPFWITLFTCLAGMTFSCWIGQNTKTCFFLSRRTE